jgi:ABC-type bacteriocin/lantibiotic exporter with double-glycine peptidase domain
MGWLEEQIRARKENDDRMLRGGLNDLAFTVSKNKKYAGAPLGGDEAASKAIDAIRGYYGAGPAPTPLKGDDLAQKLEFALLDGRVMKRSVRLTGKWYSEAVGPILAVGRGGAPVALMPNRVSGYHFIPVTGGKQVRVTSKNAGDFAENAFCFYRPLPQKKLAPRDLTAFLFRSVAFSDVFPAVFASVFIAVAGTFTPIATKLIFQNIISGEQAGALGAITMFLICLLLSAALMRQVQNSAVSRLQSRLNVAFSAAMTGRLLHLPSAFFDRYNIGTISGMLEAAENYGSTMVSAVFTIGTTALLLVVYMAQIGLMASALALPALCILAAQLVLIAASFLIDRSDARKSAECRKRLLSNTFAAVSGIQKKKLAAAEKRAFARWLVLFRDYIDAQYEKRALLVIAEPLNIFIGLAGTALLFFSAKQAGASTAEYMAFAAAFGVLSESVSLLLAQGEVFTDLSLYQDTFQPIMEQAPEETGGQQSDIRLSGSVEISNVSFKYDGSDSYVLEKLSLSIRKGEYIGIVGRTGCGKSTLVKLLLGFIKPQQGSIFFDGKDMEKLNKAALRRHIGVILQNSALVTGDIYTNIALSSVALSMEDAWKAAEMANVADDIRRMPMGMHTIVTEGSGGFSGGQKQRIMIARAIASKPNILIFDEATSALDNITQNKVAQALDGMGCTRIVIAHRLSTIRKCDRILVLDDGKIAEQGTYDELVGLHGIFSELIEKQRI